MIRTDAPSRVGRTIACDEETPCDLIRSIRPEIVAKQGNNLPERLPEAANVEGNVGEVRILPFIAERSTTDTIEQLRASTGLPRLDAGGPPHHATIWIGAQVPANGIGGRP